jgi:Asp-tRNAAsn/Glu-tRNAGln amidotransferase A subunit and related amidases
MLVQESLERAHKDEFNAVVTINEFAQKQAQELSSKGVEPFPFAVKDVIYTKGIRTTMGSRLFQDFVPSFDATVVATLKRAGGVLIGKTTRTNLRRARPQLLRSLAQRKTLWTLQGLRVEVAGVLQRQFLQGLSNSLWELTLRVP